VTLLALAFLRRLPDRLRFVARKLPDTGAARVLHFCRLQDLLAEFGESGPFMEVFLRGNPFVLSTFRCGRSVGNVFVVGFGNRPFDPGHTRFCGLLGLRRAWTLGRDPPV
jgi:hypothetical protein